MAAGDTKYATYPASSALTITALSALPTSSTYLAGWESGAVDNTSNLYTDYRITAKITVGTTLTAAEIRMYLVAPQDDTNWPDVFDGTESTETVSLAAIRDAVCKVAAVTATTTTNSLTYWLDCASVAAVFGGTLPKKFVIFITHATNANLATTSGGNNAVTVTGSYQNTAQS